MIWFDWLTDPNKIEDRTIKHQSLGSKTIRGSWKQQGFCHQGACVYPRILDSTSKWKLRDRSERCLLKKTNFNHLNHQTLGFNKLNLFGMSPAASGDSTGCVFPGTPVRLCRRLDDGQAWGALKNMCLHFAGTSLVHFLLQHATHWVTMACFLLFPKVSKCRDLRKHQEPRPLRKFSSQISWP